MNLHELVTQNKCETVSKLSDLFHTLPDKQPKKKHSDDRNMLFQSGLIILFKIY